MRSIASSGIKKTFFTISGSPIYKQNNMGHQKIGSVRDKRVLLLLLVRFSANGVSNSYYIADIEFVVVGGGCRAKSFSCQTQLLLC